MRRSSCLRGVRERGRNCGGNIMWAQLSVNISASVTQIFISDAGCLTIKWFDWEIAAVCLAFPLTPQLDGLEWNVSMTIWWIAAKFWEHVLIQLLQFDYETLSLTFPPFQLLACLQLNLLHNISKDCETYREDQNWSPFMRIKAAKLPLKPKEPKECETSADRAG